MSEKPSLDYRRKEPRADDEAGIREIVASTGFFHDHEIDIAVELVHERLYRGLESGYSFRFAESAGRVLGYACFGEVPCTRGSYDLYWIAVHADARGAGIGGRLVDLVMHDVRDLGGRWLWAETSGRALYAPTQAFYRAAGFELVATMPEFYDPGDDKLVFGRRVD